MSREEALHKAVCEAVIRLNIGENFQASHILRAALVEYADHHAPPALAEPEGYVPVPVQSLRWWRELAEINPQDLVPRIDAYLAAAERKGEQP